MKKNLKLTETKQQQPIALPPPKKEIGGKNQIFTSNRMDTFQRMEYHTSIKTRTVAVIQIHPSMPNQRNKLLKNTNNKIPYSSKTSKIKLQ